MIISTRESEEVRGKVLNMGISQISGASRTSVGGYTEEERPHDTEQFDVSDQRTLDEVVHWLMDNGHIPSFCTACYRMGRTGEHFMEFAIPGFIKRYCTPNAILTLAEYLEDYSSENTKELGYNLIAKELEKMPESVQKDKIIVNLEAIKQGKRDFRF